MLRQALDAAEGLQQQQQQQQQLYQNNPEERSSLLSHDHDHQQQHQHRALTPQGSETAGTGYGAASQTTHDEYDYDVDEEDDEEDDEGSGSMEDSYGDDDWSYNNHHHTQPLDPGVAQRAWNAIKSGFMLVANVENLWDSPVPTYGGGGGGGSIDNGTAGIWAGSSSATPTSSASTAGLRRRSYLIVLFWFFILAFSYACERSTFKLLVDRAGPFRLFSVEMVTATHAIMLGSWLALSNLYHLKHHNSEDGAANNEWGSGLRLPLGIPLVDVGYMALLDTFHLLLVFLTGRYVCPTLTVILVQFTLPLSALLTQFVHSDGQCAHLCCRNGSNDDSDDDNEEENHHHNREERRFGSYQQHHNQQGGTTSGVAAGGSSDNQSSAPSEGMPLPGWGGLSAEHLWGSLILSLAVVLALIPSFYSIINPAFFSYADQIPMQTAYNTLLYVSSCFPAAASQLYKEHVFLQNKQPVNASYLNFLLSLFQFILASVMTPLVFGLQGLGAGEDWTTLYPSSHFSTNFLAGLKCFMGMLPEETAEYDFPEPANCHWSFGLVFLHAFSIIAVGCAVDKIVNAGATKAMYRGISAGIIVAVLLMYDYDMHIPRFNYGPAVDALNLICLILLVVGAEVYHRVSLSDSVFETVYPTIDGLYDDDD